MASSTIGVAAAGLALGKSGRSSPPSSKKRKTGDTAGVVVHNQNISSPMSRPGTSSTILTTDNMSSPYASSSTPPPILQSRPQTSRIESSNTTTGKRFSILRYGDSSSTREGTDDEGRRESVSSRGSWMKRLSTIPNSSHNDSPGSSIGPDSPSLIYSQGSAAPILSDPVSSPVQLAPNKLVKRVTSTRAASGPIPKIKGQLPTLRRPATSHQRSVTLQQQFRDDSTAPRHSLQQNPLTQIHTTPHKANNLEPRHSYRLYFESRPTKPSKEISSRRLSDGGLQLSQSISRRVMPDEMCRPTLMKPEMIISYRTEDVVYWDDEDLAFDDSFEDDTENIEDVMIDTPEAKEDSSKHTRRSLSMNFSSPSTWITGNKRNPDNKSGGKRYSSAPAHSSLPRRSTVTANGSTSNKQRPFLDHNVFQAKASTDSSSSPHDATFQTRSRNSSSPLPPLSRLSSFNVDLARLGLSSSSSSGPRKSPTSPIIQANTTTTSLSSTSNVASGQTSYFSSNHSKPSRTSEVADRASTLVGSDSDARGFTSGDEDDIDYRSETIFDSLRSGATTGSVRSHKAPFDTMFDESPPSLNSHQKSKRLSIHEMLANGGFNEGHNRIVEEDEGMSTPIKAGRHSEDSFSTPMRARTVENDGNFPSSPPSFSLAAREFGSLSLDDDEEDEDWTRDDENMGISNQLSPPSNSLNARKINPHIREALADVTQCGTINGTYTSATDRPKSNLFDWSEPSSAEKLDSMGNSPRPKTAHVKHIIDGRGGRAVGRRGPSALHMRSQSVPVVPDVAGQREQSKLIPKFGTWGLGAKGVSEDWDNDFEFDENIEEDDGKDGDSKMENSGMLVPPAIQASQANVVGHVGQIREVCLLVEDLKRLRSQASERGLLHGPSASLWKEAEGIIALAVPEEEDDKAPSRPQTPPQIEIDGVVVPPKFRDVGPDLEEMEMERIQVLNRRGKATPFVYDGSTVRRRSALPPDDDIFGAGSLHSPPSRDHLRPPSVSARHSSLQTPADIARSVMETMHQHRSTSDPLLQNFTSALPKQMPFDTTSLRDLVHRAGVLTRTLREEIRKADGISQSPEVSPHRDSSPAFTRVFTDPNGSIDESPTRNLSQRMHMMTVV